MVEGVTSWDLLERGDRTRDQMIQAARSGKKNILEGSKAGHISYSSHFSHSGAPQTFNERSHLRSGLSVSGTGRYGFLLETT